MSNADIFSMALKNLFKRKLRTFLTVFGVIIGVVSIVLMMSLGIAVNMNFEKQMEGMGDLTIINIYNWEGYQGNAGAIVFDDDLIDVIARIEGVEVVTPFYEPYIPFKAVSGRYSTDLQVAGIRPEAMASLGYKAKEGTLLSPNSNAFEIVYGADVLRGFITDAERKREENNQRRGGRMVYYDPFATEETAIEDLNVDIFNDRVTASYEYNYGTRDPQYPDNKKPDVYTLTGVGILEASETQYNSIYNCFMDIEKLQEIVADMEKYQKATGQGGMSQTTYGYESGFIKCTNIDVVESVMEEVYALGFTEYALNNPTTYLNQTKQTYASLQILLAAIGGVALFVAAIGIANTMIMSIYERTREIGIMKVIGAAIRDIQKLFLLEAAMIGFMGGVLGIILSYIASFTLNNVGLSFFESMVYLPNGEKAIISFIPIWLALASLAFAALIGVVSGYFPARRAMKLSALSAIKTE
ncbi:MAG: ABC transporter permease [Clostridiales bacterium]|jgi:ABC-type antimicrobial peptide transport system permease subunit|nr:ABC transporter permease [Clostridiales bacterium]